jgi:uncharacterized heparinase superfamily protein
MPEAALAAQVRPRPVFCINAQTRRDRALADAVRAGRFTELGLTLDLGPEPDWLGAELPADVEWRIAWSKFYFGLDLAHAFAETGDAGYLHAWERLVRSWIEQVPFDVDPTDAIARRMANWVYAWDAFAGEPGFPGLADGLEEAILVSLAAQIEHLRANLTKARNHRTLELYALFVVALALPALDADGELLAFATRELHRNLLADLRPDGVHCEASTHYHMVVLRSFVGARENARRYGVVLPADYDEHLARALRFARHCHRPDGGIPMLSDSDAGSYGDLLALGADLLDDGEPLGPVSFPDAGYHVQRHADRHLIFDCGPLGDGGHGHYDLLSFELAAGGGPLVVDPGRYSYSEIPERAGDPPNPRHWFKGTAAHNTVCVDGLDQTPYRVAKPKGPVAEGRLIGRFTAAGLDVLLAEATSPCYDAVHTRRVVFVGGAYWLVEDRLTAPSPHRYDLRFHLAPGAWGRVAVEGRTVRAPGLSLVCRGPGEPAVEAGWVAPEYGVKRAAPIVSVAAEAAEATFITLLAPAPDAEMRVLRDGEHTIVEVGRDLVEWDESGPAATWTRTP